MSQSNAERTLPWDWYEGKIPENVTVGEGAYLETTYSFLHYRSQLAQGVTIGAGATTYLGTMFDVGPGGRVKIGNYALLHGAWIICDAEVEIGDYALISWNVVLMDNTRACADPKRRREELMHLARAEKRRPTAACDPQPIRIGRNVWIGFDCCVLPGVSIGEDSVVGARSVVTSDVPPRTIVAGNPARIIRTLSVDELATTN